MSAGHTGMTPDERYDATRAAAERERRNRPRHFVVLGGLLFAGACVALLGAWASRSGAESELGRERSRTASILRLGAELDQLRELAASDPGAARLFEPDPNFLSKVRDLGPRAGLARTVITPKSSSRDYGDGRRVDWPYDITDADLGAVLAWVRLVMDEIPGTFVTNINLAPNRNEWRVRVTLSRYEH